MKYAKIMQENGYVLNTKPYQLNILGIRSSQTIPNKFDDFIVVFYKSIQNKWVIREYKATTDPSTYWLLNPTKVNGTALLMQGQYQYKLGKHKGQYDALVPAGSVTLLRQYQRQAYLDFFNGVKEVCKNGCGINIHRAKASGTTEDIDLYSAGCQVFANAEDFKEFIDLCKQHAKMYGNAFLYTLVDERALIRRNRRWSIYAFIVCLILAILIYLFYYKNEIRKRI